MPPKRIPLIQGAYTAQSFIAAAQRCLNLIPEKNPAGEDSPLTDYPRPGLTPLGVPPAAARVRGLYRASNGQLFSAVGSGIYYVAPDWTSTPLGTTAVNTTPVKMGDNGTTMTIVDGSASGWLVNLTTHAYSAQGDANFFGSNSVESLDTFQLFNKPGTNIFYCSLSNSTTFDPLAFAAKVGYSDGLAGIAVQNRNPWLIGAQATSEIWFDAGAADFPFQILPGPFVEHGAIAIYSIAKQGGSVFWLSQDQYGTTIVVEGANFTTRRISTHAIETAISRYGVISDATGYCWEQRGHAFYALLFPSANDGLGATWVYDLSTQLWHEEGWLNPATCEPEGHRAFATAFAYGVNVVGDRENGQLYFLDPDNPTDAGAFIERRRGFPHLVADGNRVSYPSFIADMAAATPGTTLTPAALPTGLVSPLLFPATVVVVDTTFTAPDGTLLQNYFNPYGLVDTGSQYSILDNTISGEVASDLLTGNGVGTTSYLASGTPTGADQVLQFQAVPDSYGNAPAAGKNVAVIGRSNGTITGHGYKLAVISDGAQYQLALTIVAVSAAATVDMGLLTSGYFEAYLSCQGTSIQAACQRSQDAFWLTSSGTWQADFTTAFSITDANYTTAGRIIIGGQW